MINKQIDPFWESPDQTSTNLTSSSKNPNLSELKSTQPANQKIPKVKFGTTNLARILLAHQILRPYLYPQKLLPQIAQSNLQDSYQSTTWPPKRKLQLLPPPEEEGPVPHQHRHQPQCLPQQQTLSNKSKRRSTPPSVIPAEEETQEEDRVHLDPQAVEELRQTLQYLLHKYQLQRQLTFTPWAPPHTPSQGNAMKQRTGSTNCEDIIVLTLESQ